MPKSHDDQDDVDPIDYAQMAREEKEREARRKHRGYEPSSAPPPPDLTWPPPAVPGIGSPSPYRGRMPSAVGFQVGVAHIAHAAGHIPKRIAVILGAWGSLSWMAAVALTHWTSHSVVSLDRYAKDEAVHTVERNAFLRDIEGLRSTINDQRVKIAALEAMANMMQQQPLQSEKKRSR